VGFADVGNSEEGNAGDKSKGGFDGDCHTFLYELV
jgi:hypothetical protein